MLRSLSVRLALSHTLPVLVFVPFLGLILLYQLERTYFLENLAKDLAGQGQLIAQFTGQDEPLWHDPAYAGTLLTQLHQHNPSNVMLLDRDAHLLASTLAGEQAKIGQPFDVAFVQRAAGGQTVWMVDQNASGEQPAVDVVVPVLDGQGALTGFVRLSQRLTDLQQRLNQQRWLVMVTLLASAGISLLLGLLLARSLGAPLIHLTEIVARFNPERSPERLPEQGPDELKTLAATFNRQSRHLYELERTRKSLLSGIVHELGRPLGSIKTAAQTIQHNEDRALCVELAGGISDQIDQLRLQIDDLALLGELDIQGIALNREPVDLGELVEAQCRQFARLAAHQGLTLSCQLPPMLPLIVADPQRIGQVLSNLLHNACKYTPAGGHIAVSASVENREDGPATVVVAVTDDGPGIALSEQESIFQLFYRSPSQRRIHEGMGIGLALARQLVHAHGGSLAVVSQPGQGASFYLRLPIEQTTPT